jgi:hypothetical protein
VIVTPRLRHRCDAAKAVAATVILKIQPRILPEQNVISALPVGPFFNLQRENPERRMSVAGNLNIICVVAEMQNNSIRRTNDYLY